MKKGILFIAMAFLITAGLSAQDQLLTQLKTQDKDQIQDPDKDQLQIRKKDKIHQTDAVVEADQDKDQLRTRKKDQTQDPDQDQLKTKDQIRLHSGVSAKSARPASGAMKNAGATGARKAQGASGASTGVRKVTRSGMGPKR